MFLQMASNSQNVCFLISIITTASHILLSIC
nr:MAG TPA: hypothetical protein [Caudoviricetes sp.]